MLGRLVMAVDVAILFMALVLAVMMKDLGDASKFAEIPVT
jgi:hypothetical protein